jgi:hypothetical protein
MSSESPENWFWSQCAAIESKPKHARSELESELIEFSDLRSRAGGASSSLYYIDSYDIRPSRLASLLTEFGPPEIAAIARDLSRLYPDDMPQGQQARQAYIEDRFARIDTLGLTLELNVEDRYEILDEYCMGNGVHELYRKLQEALAAQ